MVVLWDSLGTLLDVGPVQNRYPGWLERVLHHGAALALVGEFRAVRGARETLRRAGVEAEDACLIAAHAWDVLAAVRYGLRAVWVDRLEQRWPLPGDPHEPRSSSLPEAARLALGA